MTPIAFIRSPMPSSSTTVFVLSLSLLMVAPVLAAPTTETPVVQTPQTVRTAPAAAEVRQHGKATEGDARTIDLLLQAQQPSAGLQFNERKGSSESSEGRARTTSLPNAVPASAERTPRTETLPQTPQSGLFGAGATPQVQNSRPMPTPTTSSDESSARRASSGPSGTELARWFMLPREVIDYLRENRGFVLGCVAGVLLLAWSGSLMFSRRRG